MSLDLDYNSFSFKETTEITKLEPDEDERNLLVDLLTDIEQESSMRVYKYFYTIFVMLILLLGCLLYHTIVVPCICLLLLLIL